MENIYTDIPTWDNGTWTTTSFDSRDEWRDYVLTLFKEPGQYEFNEVTNEIFIIESTKFRKDKVYCVAPFKSKDFINYWEDQKTKCRLGVLIKSKGKTWYLSRDYYMWLNFLPIFDKEQQKFDFAQIRDAQYHMALYEILAELFYKHVAILKKRQIASSYFHAGKLINQLWFEAGVTLKMGASLKDYINEKGTWKFLSEYAAFLNEHTAWYRPMSPDKVMMWQQKIDIRKGDRKAEVGLKGTIQGMSFEKDPTNGVGGPVKFFFHEEAGIAPKMNTTFGYIKPALKSGMITTGLFIAAGSVGDLDQCEPLKKMILDPEANEIYAVETDLIDDEGTIGMSGLFIPEQWSMPPYIDDYGNSLVEESLVALDEYFEKIKKTMDPEDYQLEISQHPRNIAEAFRHRKVSKFPSHLVTAQIRRIEDKEYGYEHLDIFRDETGKVKTKDSNKLPIREFPMTKKTEDKTGVLVVWERPQGNPGFGQYYASIDPVAEGKAEHVDNMLYTPTGRKRIGDIQIGNQVIGSNGKSTNVIGIYPQGIKKMCNITFSDGHSIKVCEDHLWNVKLNGGTKGYITLSVKDLLDSSKTITYNGTGRNIKKEYTISTYYKDKENRNKWSIPIVKPISFDLGNILPINSYLLGLLLGDGGLSQKSIRFSTVDIELINSIEHILEDDLLIKKVKNSNCDYAIITKVGSRNSLTKRLKELGLKGKRSEDKFIPQEYMYAIGSSRLSLLQGLMDTDGSYSNHGAEFYSSSKTLAYQVIELVQSLGGIAKIRCKKTTHLDSYIVRVLLPEYLNPFILKRKREIYKPSKVFSRYITNIEYIDDAEAVCISVDAPDNLYVTEHALVTHNTTTSDSLCSIYVMKAPVEVTKVTGVDTETYIEEDKIVAAWCGRFDDIKQTHERLEMIIEWYNAWTVVENNISHFINYMISKKKQRYLVQKDQIMFLKDLGANKSVFQDYGWRNTGVLFKHHLLSYVIEYTKEELDTVTKEDGTIVKTKYGIERIPDIMLLKEMHAYVDGLNVDRLVAFSALVAFMRIQQANRGYTKKVIMDDAGKNLEKSKNLYKLTSNPFRNLGKGMRVNGELFRKSAFKNFK
jgi:hypothetical protein